MSRKSKKRAKQAVPVEILAEGSGPNEAVAADAQALADAAADALASAEIAEVEAEVEAVAMAAEVVVVAAEAARAEAREAKKDKKAKKKGKKSEPAAEPEVALDAWGQPILVEPDAEREVAGDAETEAAEPVAADSTDGAPDADAIAASAAADTDDAAPDADAIAAADDTNNDDDRDETRMASDDEIAADEASDEEVIAAAAERADESLADDVEMRADDGDGIEAADDESAEAGEPGEGDESGEGDADGVMPTSAATMDATQLKHLVEALVFAADKPVTIQRLRQLTRVADVTRLETALAELAEDYKARGIALQVVSGGYQFRTNTTYSGWVQQLIAGRPVRLSRAQLETLAIVAYRQPITRPEIDEIRGVDSSSTLKVLLDRALIRILGKREEAGRPVLYGTTKEFLDFFSLGDLRELPTLREYSELTAESRKVVSDRLGVSLDGTPLADAVPESDTAGDEDETSAEAPEPTMDDALRAYVDDPSVETGASESSDLSGEPNANESAELSGEPNADESAESHVDESAALSGEPNTDDSAELSAGSHVDESAVLSGEPNTDGSVERSAKSHGDESPETSGELNTGESAELSGKPNGDDPAESHVDEPAALSDENTDESVELSADSYADESAELATESHVEEPAELSANSHVDEPAELSPEFHVDESAELSGDPNTDESAELSAESHVDESAELSAEPHVGEPANPVEAHTTDDAGSEQAGAEHGFIDPEELAGRVVAGESDVHASGRDDSADHALESAAAADAESVHADGAHGDPGEPADGDSDGADTSAHDEPPVD